jgi:hypothetical protein
MKRHFASPLLVLSCALPLVPCAFLSWFPAADSAIRITTDIIKEVFDVNTKLIQMENGRKVVVM